jgi:orotate phosphoribosyltransferase
MIMKKYKQEFIEFMVKSQVLIFGDFTTKSGRKTPYFINTGNYTTGTQIKRLGQYYAKTIYNHFGDAVDVLFGPAYKGIPLVVSTAIALKNQYDLEVEFCFNRKESKDHGEKGVFVGKTLADGDQVVIVEDVTTAGTSIRNTVPLLYHAADIELQGLVVSVDRMEKGRTERGALIELAEEYDMITTAIATLDDIVESLSKSPIDGELILTEKLLQQIKHYREKYGSVLE